MKLLKVFYILIGLYPTVYLAYILQYVSAGSRYLSSDQGHVWLVMTVVAIKLKGRYGLICYPYLLLILEAPVSPFSFHLLQHTQRKCFTYSSRSRILSLRISA